MPRRRPARFSTVLRGLNVAGVGDLLHYPTNEYSVERPHPFTGKGYTKGSDGFRANASGRLKLEVGWLGRLR